MIVLSAVTALRQILSPPFRAVLWKSLGLTALLLVLIWVSLTQIFSRYLESTTFGNEHPILEGFTFFLAGAGLFVALAYLMPAVSALVAGFFLDDVAEQVERLDYPLDPPGQPLSFGLSLLYGLRFAALSVVVNLAALTLFFIPGVNVAAFFFANAYLLGREYFELAAGRFRGLPEARAMRRYHRGTIMLGGALTAALVLIPIVNLLTPLFGVALMVHLHKQLSERDRLAHEAQAARLQDQRVG